VWIKKFFLIVGLIATIAIPLSYALSLFVLFNAASALGFSRLKSFHRKVDLVSRRLSSKQMPADAMLAILHPNEAVSSVQVEEEDWLENIFMDAPKTYEQEPFVRGW
jgi:hypothetical protein